MGWVLIVLSALSFAGLTFYAWTGHLGLVAMGLLIVSAAFFLVGRRKLPVRARRSIDWVAKISFTVVGCMALLRHPIQVEGETSLPIYAAIIEYIDKVDRNTFLLFAGVAMAVKFVGVMSSAWAWHLLLKGQGLKFPFWNKIFTAFLIGRFIGTFLPSTIGLDGYTLYEAGRYSNEWPRVLTAKVLEKFIGVVGLFLGMVLTMPFGYQVIVDVTNQIGRPETAPFLAAGIAMIGGGISSVVVVTLVWPTPLQMVLQVMRWGSTLIAGVLPSMVSGIVDKVIKLISSFTQAVGAYRGR